MNRTLIKYYFLFFFSVGSFASFSQTDTLAQHKLQQKEIKKITKMLMGKWWLLSKTCPGNPVVKQETRLKAQQVDDTMRPLLRIEFKRKGIVAVKDFPFMKAANGASGTWEVKVKRKQAVGEQALFYYEIVFSNEVNSFIGFADAKGLLFNWKGKHLQIVDVKECKFEFRED